MWGSLSTLGGGGAIPPPRCLSLPPLSDVSLCHPNSDEDFPDPFHAVSRNRRWNRYPSCCSGLPWGVLLASPAWLTCPKHPLLEPGGGGLFCIAGDRMWTCKKELVLNKIVLMWTPDPEVSGLSVPVRNQSSKCSISQGKGEGRVFYNDPREIEGEMGWQLLSSVDPQAAVNQLLRLICKF